MAQPATENRLGDRFPKPGDVFIDRYEIEEVLNRGGFGCVYRAKQTELNRSVAIKILRPARRIGFADDKASESRRLDIVAKRFEREAQLVSQLRDPHTVMMYDYGTTDEGLLYMVLEYVDGRPLSEVLVRQGAMSSERCVKIARQILMSLQEAHALGMLHRDIKPPNIMLFDHVGRTDQVRVLDFGLAKSIDDPKFTADDPDLTDAEVLIGTPRYMSPEQIRGEKLTAATDVYSLGLVMYEMLVGKKAVTSTSTMNTLARHINDEPIKLPDVVKIPPRLREVVDTMLNKQIDERYEDVDTVLRALEDWDEGLEDIVGLESLSEESDDAPEPEPADDSDLFGGITSDDDSDPSSETEFDPESTYILEHLQEGAAEYKKAEAPSKDEEPSGAAAVRDASEELDDTFFSGEFDENLGADYTMEARRKERKVRGALAIVLLLFLLIAGIWIAVSGDDEELTLPDREPEVATDTTKQNTEEGQTAAALAENENDEKLVIEDDEYNEENEDAPSEFVFGDEDGITAGAPDAGAAAEPDAGVAVAEPEETPEVAEKEETKTEPRPRPRKKPKKKPTLKLRTLK